MVRINGFATVDDVKLAEPLRKDLSVTGDEVAEKCEDIQAGVTIYRKPLLEWSRQWEYSYVLYHGQFAAGLRVLDVGSGFTFFPFHLERLGCDVTATDVDRRLVSAFTRANERLQTSVRFALDDITQTTLAPGSFDRVLCISVLEHLPKKLLAARALCGLTKKGGLLIVTMDFGMTIQQQDLSQIVKTIEEDCEPVLESDWNMPANPLKTSIFPKLTVVGGVWRKK